MNGRMLFVVPLCLLLVPSATPVQSSDRLPPGWRRVGPPQTGSQYVIQLDRQTKRSGTSSLRIRSKPFAVGFAGFSQAIDARPYRGSRVRLRGYARASQVSQWAGLWMRIDGPTAHAIDNMKDRPFKGTADWTAADIVLDVPTDAVQIVIGALLSGPGTLWIDDFAFDSVPESVATTAEWTYPPPRELPNPADLPVVPVNLGFEPEK